MANQTGRPIAPARKLVAAVLGTTLLRSYLLSRSDSQLRNFATVATRIVERQQLQPAGSSRSQVLPTQFLVELIGADGKVQGAGGPLGSASVRMRRVYRSPPSMVSAAVAISSQLSSARK